MLLLKRPTHLRSQLERMRRSPQSIGFVPTMGALHAGHLSLIEASQADNALTVCSIFVNPTQFNEATDLEQYPRTLYKDLPLLAKVGCDIVFLPDVTDIYPADASSSAPFDPGYLARSMEGAHRPGHFQGVVQVMDRLLAIVSPDHLYMGQKDYQQFAIIAAMIDHLALPVEIHRCPTIREADGLAMSSRNQRLTPAARQQAPVIYQALQQARQSLPSQDPQTVARQATTAIAAAGLQPEYFEIVDGRSLQPITSYEQTDSIVACTAAWAGEVRLIDNMVMKD